MFLFGLDPNIQTVAAKGVGLIAIVAENLLSHPFLVLRRQCQVRTILSIYNLIVKTTEDINVCYYRFILSQKDINCFPSRW